MAIFIQPLNPRIDTRLPNFIGNLLKKAVSDISSHTAPEAAHLALPYVWKFQFHEVASICLVQTEHVVSTKTPYYKLQPPHIPLNTKAPKMLPMQKINFSP